MYRATITNEEINLMPVTTFTGRIIVADSAETMIMAEQALMQAKVIGFDTETRPSFRKGVSYKTALLQLSTEDTAVLIRLQYVGLSTVIKGILQSPEVLKIGAAIRDDIRGLQQFKRYQPAGFVDLQTIVRRWGIEDLSVKKMAAIVLGVKVSKAQRLSNWEAAQLTHSQMDYAAVDAWVCQRIYTELMANEIVEK